YPVVSPQWVVQNILAFSRWPFPPLEALVETPVLRPDGTVLKTAGYDPATRLLYVPRPGLQVPLLSHAPTTAHVGAARDALLDILHDFPFVDDAGRANTLGLLLTPVLRPAVPGQVPLALIDKPKRGTGATLLAQLVTLVAFGSMTDMMTAPREDE